MSEIYLKSESVKDCEKQYCTVVDGKKVYDPFNSWVQDVPTFTKPELYLFPEQKKEDIEKIINEKSNKSFSLPKEFLESTRSHRLIFDDKEQTTIDLNNFRKSEFHIEEKNQVGPSLSVNEDFSSEWRVLSGIKPDEKVYPSDDIKCLTELIVLKIAFRFPSLNLSWSDDYKKSLKINGLITKLDLIGLMKAWEGLCIITDSESAACQVADIVVNKISSLFA